MMNPRRVTLCLRKKPSAKSHFLYLCFPSINACMNQSDDLSKRETRFRENEEEEKRFPFDI